MLLLVGMWDCSTLANPWRQSSILASALPLARSWTLLLQRSGLGACESMSSEPAKAIGSIAMSGLT
jgi:hypothetical protein